MNKTGQVGNIILGIGDPSKFTLLGGTFGKAGDVSIVGSGAGARIFVKQRDTILQNRGATTTGGTTGPGVRPRPGPQPPPTPVIELPP